MLGRFGYSIVDKKCLEIKYVAVKKLILELLEEL